MLSQVRGRQGTGEHVVCAQYTRQDQVKVLGSLPFVLCYSASCVARSSCEVLLCFTMCRIIMHNGVLGTCTL